MTPTPSVPKRLLSEVEMAERLRAAAKRLGLDKGPISEADTVRLWKEAFPEDYR